MVKKVQKNKHWAHKEYHLEKWLHKHLLMKNDLEFAFVIFWGMIIALFIYSIS